MSNQTRSLGISTKAYFKLKFIDDEIMWNQSKSAILGRKNNKSSNKNFIVIVWDIIIYFYYNIMKIFI